MAVLGKIRQRTGLLLAVVVAGIGLFILGDFITSGFSFFEEDPNQVAVVNGRKVSAQEFGYISEQLKVLYPKQGNIDDEQYNNSLRSRAWDKILFDNVYQPQFEELGLTVTSGDEESEEVDMVQGFTVDDLVKSFFSNNNPQQFDVQNVIQYLQYLNTEDNEQAQQANAQFTAFISEVKDQRLRGKYEELITKSFYVTEQEAKEAYKEEQITSDFEYVYIPYRSLPDSSVEVTDQMVSKYANEHKEEFAVNEEERAVKYIALNITSKGADTLAAKNRMDEMIAGIKKSKRPISYASSMSDADNSGLQKASFDQLPFLIRMDSTKIDSGAIFGPTFNGSSYMAYMVTNVVDDSVFNEKVTASHILFKTEGISDQAAYDAKRAQAEEVLKLALDGEDFAELARKYSEGPSATKGGELGEFGKGAMVPQFEAAAFAAREEGVLPTIVETRFGFHIIHIEKPQEFVSVSDQYQYVVLQKNIVPGKGTRADVYRRANIILSKIDGDISKMEELSKEDSTIEVKTAKSISMNSQGIDVFRNARSVVTWAFSADEGDVRDRVVEVDNNYLIVALEKVVEAEEVNVEARRTVIESKVRDQLKAEKLKEYLSSKLTDDFAATVKTINEEKSPSFASHNIVKAHKFNSNFVTGASSEPKMVGTAFALKEGEKSEIIEGDFGVFVIKGQGVNTEVAESESYDVQKTRLENNKSSEKFGYNAVIKNNADIEDTRYHVY